MNGLLNDHRFERGDHILCKEDQSRSRNYPVIPRVGPVTQIPRCAGSNVEEDASSKPIGGLGSSGFAGVDIVVHEPSAFAGTLTVEKTSLLWFVIRFRPPFQARLTHVRAERSDDKSWWRNLRFR